MGALVNLKARAAQVAVRTNHRIPRFPVPRLSVPVVAACVYRARNAKHVARMVQQLPDGADVRLHALADPVPALDSLTLSTGPGARMPLLQRLLDSAPVPDDA